MTLRIGSRRRTATASRSQTKIAPIDSDAILDPASLLQIGCASTIVRSQALPLTNSEPKTIEPGADGVAKTTAAPQANAKRRPLRRNNTAPATAAAPSSAACGQPRNHSRLG